MDFRKAHLNLGERKMKLILRVPKLSDVSAAKRGCLIDKLLSLFGDFFSQDKSEHVLIFKFTPSTDVVLKIEVEAQRWEFAHLSEISERILFSRLLGIASSWQRPNSQVIIVVSYVDAK